MLETTLFWSSGKQHRQQTRVELVLWRNLELKRQTRDEGGSDGEEENQKEHTDPETTSRVDIVSVIRRTTRGGPLIT